MNYVGSCDAWQDNNGDGSEARSSNQQQRLPAMTRPMTRQVSAPAAATTTGQRQNNATAQTRQDIAQRSAARSLRDHWSLSSYSPGERRVYNNTELIK